MLLTSPLRNAQQEHLLMLEQHRLSLKCQVAVQAHLEAVAREGEGVLAAVMILN